jgi:hypothetical protein
MTRIGRRKPVEARAGMTWATRDARRIPRPGMAVLDIPARKAVQQMTIIPTKEKLTSSSIASWTDLQILLPRFSEQTLLFTA